MDKSIQTTKWKISVAFGTMRGTWRWALGTAIAILARKLYQMAVWPSGLRRLTRNQFRSRAHVRIMQPSLHSFFLFFFFFSIFFLNS
ncbi:hypothetical protein VN97_g1066 [Penicillium thymicola]|uniref:Uncharacterized protein n=1 Tax=Penicillium thymicola TaxID=293382 RepID=A0AAI9XD27_PENTH|nr:hypothetical protein VN97_g1066 [Penicillium thymicola]